MDDYLRASKDGLQIVKDAGRKKGWKQTTTLEWWRRANTTQATLKRFWQGRRIDGSAFRGICEAVGVNWKEVAELSQIQKTELPVVSAISTTPSVQSLNFVGREGLTSFALPEKIAPVRNWVGRVQELNTLKAQILDPETRAITITAVCVVGLAGIGKTTLASQLVRQLQAENAPFIAAAWESLRSITGKPPRFESIMDSLLLTLSNGEITATVTILDDYHQKTERLVKLLKDRPYLVVLDNVETVLQIRQARRAGYFADDCAEYAWLFQQLVETEHQSRVVFTSREILAQLQRRETRTFQLGGLDPNSAVTLLQSFALIATQEELTKLAKRYEGHPQALKIIAAVIQEDFQGKVERFLQERKWLLIRDLDSLIDEAINRLSEEEYACLSQVSVYQTTEHPLLDEGITAQMPEVSERDLKENIILALRRRQLLDYDPNHECYQMHPLVQEKASYLLDSQTSHIAHRQAYQYFISIAKHETEWKEFEDIKPILRAYYHACQAKEWDEAAVAILKAYKQLRRWSYFALLIDLYNELIPENWKEGQQLVESSSLHSEIILRLGITYQDMGERQTAQEYLQQCLFISCKIGDRKMEAMALSYIGINYEQMGNFEKAVEYLENSHAIVTTELDEGGIKYRSLEQLGLTYCSLGRYHSAIEFFKQCLEITQQDKLKEKEGICMGNLGDAYSHIGKFELAIECAQKFLDIAEQNENPKITTYALAILAQAYNVGAQVSNTIELYYKAINLSEECIKIARDIMNQATEAWSLRNIGVAYRGIKKYEQSLNCFMKCLEIYRKTNARSKEGEILYELGVNYRELESFDESITNLQNCLIIFRECGSRANLALALLEIAKTSFYASNVSQENIQDYLNHAELICMELQLPLLIEVKQIKFEFLGVI